MPSFKIAPSLLSADLGNLNAEIASLDKYVDFIHLDVMDGHFVPNLTFGAPVVKCLKSRVPLEAHLMISNPEKYLEDFAKAGSWMITIHFEATLEKTGEVLRKIRDLGVKPAISLNPPTEVKLIEPYLELVDQVLVMSVHPGFGGQAFIEDSLLKIKRLRELKSSLDICVDGGINLETAQKCLKAGANVLVVGSFLLRADNRQKIITELRELK